MSLKNELAELIREGVISTETAENIRGYYLEKEKNQPRRLFAVFGILGAILIGLGIILIVAHNWDNLSRGLKTSLSLFPLIIGQLLCGYVILKKMESLAWRESTAAFLFFAVGASIALIAQVYNMPGDMASYLFTWMLLTLPLVYVMRSSAVSMFYIIGISSYATSLAYDYPRTTPYLYWPLLLLILPHYYQLYRNSPNGNFITFHNWMIPLSVIICLGTMAGKQGELMYVAYCSLFGLFYLVGSLDYFQSANLSKNGFLVLGACGTVILLLMLSYDWVWNDLARQSYRSYELVATPAFILSALLTAIAGLFLYFYQTNSSRRFFSPLAIVFLVFIPIFIIGHTSAIAQLLINLIIVIIGVLTIRNGIREEHFGILNYGLLTLVALIGCRFTDTDLGFLFKGLLFVFAGIGFIATNYWMLKKRNAND